MASAMAWSRSRRLGPESARQAGKAAAADLAARSMSSAVPRATLQNGWLSIGLALSKLSAIGSTLPPMKWPTPDCRKRVKIVLGLCKVRGEFRRGGGHLVHAAGPSFRRASVSCRLLRFQLISGLLSVNLHGNAEGAGREDIFERCGQGGENGLPRLLAGVRGAPGADAYGQSARMYCPGGRRRWRRHRAVPRGCARRLPGRCRWRAPPHAPWRPGGRVDVRLQIGRVLDGQMRHRGLPGKSFTCDH